MMAAISKPLTFKKAIDAFQVKDARLMLMNTRAGQEYFIVPGGKVTPEIAQHIMNRPDVGSCDDGLFPGTPQQWKIVTGGRGADFEIDISGILGLQVTTEDGACKHCGTDTAIVRAGKAMHAAALLCSACGRFRQWLSADAVENVGDLYHASKRMFGPPDVRIRTKRIPQDAECAAALGEAAASSSSTQPSKERTKMKVSEEFPSKYLKATDLKGQDVKVTIQNVIREKIGDENKLIVFFKGREKGLVLNKTNANTIADLYGDDCDEWFGRPLVLFSVMTDFQGKVMQGIRVRGLTARDNPKKNDPISSKMIPPDEMDNDMNDDIPF
jgi:hypothetical protein